MSSACPKVSIGMPVYNGEKFIREAIDSLLKQKFADFELIISDNASTDNTYKICLEYAERDARVKYIRQVENKGALANFNFVLEKAYGDYFMWAAADDIWSENWLEALMSHARTGLMCFGKWQLIGLNGEFIGGCHYDNVTFPKTRLMRSIGLILPYPVPYNHLIYGLYPTSSLKSSDAISAFEKLTASLTPHGNEINALFVLLQKHEVLIDDSAIFYYRIGGISTPSNKSLISKVYSYVIDPIYVYSGTIKLLSLLPKSDRFRYLLYAMYPLVATFRALKSYSLIVVRVIYNLQDHFMNNRKL